MVNSKDLEACRLLVNDIQALESRCHRLGVHITGHALNRAKNALGWEMAGNAEQAAKAGYALAER